MTYTIYADVILLNNFTMDFLLLSAVRRMMKLEARKGGLVLASLAGAVYALAVMIVPLPVFFLQTFFTCAGMSTMMAMLAFRIRGPAETLRAVAGLYLAAVMAAGIMELFRPFGWFSVFWIYAAAAVGSVGVVSLLWKTVSRESVRNSHLCRVEISYRERTETFVALLDTGNHLTEPITGKPVSILSAAAGQDLFGTLGGVLFVPFRTVGREQGLIPAVCVDRMEIRAEGWKQVIEHPYIAISKEPLSQDNSYQMLLNEKFWM